MFWGVNSACGRSMVDGHGKLRKKGKGATEMVSAFTDESRGLGLPLSADELRAVKSHRQKIDTFEG
eukprot:COSAG01_NODE_64426_length_276_cov_1.152542_1_plen_65_part_10